MADTTSKPLRTIGERLRYAHSLYPSASSFSLRDVDRLCVPALGLGHTRQIADDAIKDPGVSTIDRLARVLGCSFEWLGTGRGKAPTKRAVLIAVNRASMLAAQEGGAK